MKFPLCSPSLADHSLACLHSVGNFHVGAKRNGEK